MPTTVPQWSVPRLNLRCKGRSPTSLEFPPAGLPYRHDLLEKPLKDRPELVHVPPSPPSQLSWDQGKYASENPGSDRVKISRFIAHLDELVLEVSEQIMDKSANRRFGHVRGDPPLMLEAKCHHRNVRREEDGRDLGFEHAPPLAWLETREVVLR